jgi:hypothetical protein
MANVLSKGKRQQVIVLGQLGWTLRRIEDETGIRRETVSAYLKAAGITVRPRRARRLPAKPASQVTTDSNPASRVPTDPATAGPLIDGWPPRPAKRSQASLCEPDREFIEYGEGRGVQTVQIAPRNDCTPRPESAAQQALAAHRTWKAAATQRGAAKRRRLQALGA